MLFYPVARRAHPVHLATRRFDSLLDDTLTRFFQPVLSDGAQATRAPSLDVVESDTAYTVTLDVPGVARDQLKVSIEGKRVSIETQQAAESERKDGERVVYSERSTRRFARSVALPAEVDQAASQAKLDSGVLTLTLVKKVPVAAAQIAIN